MNVEKKYGFWNWGTGLAIVITLGALAFLYMVYLTQKIGYDTVVDNSYDEEVHHNGVLIARDNAKNLSKPVAVTQDGQNIIVTLPDELKQGIIDGKIIFYRASDKALDINATFNNTASGYLVYPATQFKKGKYTAQLFWKMNGKEYESNTDFFIP